MADKIGRRNSGYSKAAGNRTQTLPATAADARSFLAEQSSVFETDPDPHLSTVTSPADARPFAGCGRPLLVLAGFRRLSSVLAGLFSRLW